MTSKDDPPTLRILTYMVPGQPLELFQCYQRYLEQTLGCHSYLMVESRWSGPGADRVDPFTADHADIAFMCAPSYLKQFQRGNKNLELLPAAPVFIHPLGNLQPVYFSEIIVLSDKATTYRSLADLEGTRWAYNDEESLSGNFAVRREVAKIRPQDNGTSSFFGEVVKSGSHHNSIQMIKDGVVHFAAIDSLTLTNWFRDHPEEKNRLHIVCSIGPNPVPPAVINTRLPAKFRDRITNALLDMNKDPEWKKELGKHNVWGFKRIDSSVFDGLNNLVPS